MPLFQRQLVPVYLGRQALSPSVAKNLILDAVFVNTLGGVIRQLGSLSKFAEDLFAHILDDIGKIRTRAEKMNGRLTKIKDTTLKLNAAEEKVNIEDIGTQRHFKSNNIPDHHIFCDETLPRPLREVYNSKCDDKPTLTAFDVYRSDGKDSLQYYTNPAYFFDLWVENERKRLNKTMVKRKRRRKKKKQEKREDIIAPQRKVYKTEMDLLREPSDGTTAKSTSPKPSQALKDHSQTTATSSMRTQPAKQVKFQEPQKSNTVNGTPTGSITSSPISRSAAVEDVDTWGQPSSSVSGTHLQQTSDKPIHPPDPVAQLVKQQTKQKNTPLGPQAPLTSSNSSIPAPPPGPSVPSVSSKPSFDTSGPPPPSDPPVPPPPSGPPAPPPPSGPPAPPPPSGPPAPPPPPNPSVPPPPTIKQVSKSIGVGTVSDGGKRTPVQSSGDGRNDLLDAIRKGKQLRKVEEREIKQDHDKAEQGMDVASILARRVAFVSESESDDDDEDDDDSDWDD